MYPYYDYSFFRDACHRIYHPSSIFKDASQLSSIGEMGFRVWPSPSLFQPYQWTMCSKLNPNNLIITQIQPKSFRNKQQCLQK
jgi:hypothetical protein